MNRKVALSISTLMGGLTLMAGNLVLAAAPEPAPTLRAEQIGAMDTTTTYQGFRPAVPGMVPALEAGEQCHESGQCSAWVANLVEANSADRSQHENSWGARMSVRIFGSLQPIAKNARARIEHVACSEHACFAEVTYAKAGLTEHEIVAIGDQLRTAVSTSGWAQSGLEVAPSLHGFGGLLYEGPATNPVVDVIWVWPRK